MSSHEAWKSEHESHMKCRAELSATKEKLEAENNLKNLYRGELEQTVEQRNLLAKKLEAAEKRIRESQELEPVSWEYVMRFVPAFSSDRPDFYTMPPIPPELAELQRDKDTAMRLVAKTTEENEVLKRSILRVLPTLVEDENCQSSVVEILTQAAHFIKK